MAEVLIHGVIGGREEAIAQAITASPEVTRVELDDGNLEDGLARFARSSEKPFVIIGPEAPLVAGVADQLRADGYVVFGAGKEAAQYEASKSRASKMAQAAGVRLPATFITEGDNLAADALEYVETHDPRSYVIKADGLAAGKGVVLPDTIEEARMVVQGMADGTLFGGAGANAINFQERKKAPKYQL